MASSCMLLSVLCRLAVACNKPGRNSRGFWTADEFEDSVDDDCDDDNRCLLLPLLLCKLPTMCKACAPLLGAESVLTRPLPCTLRGMLLMGVSC